MEKALKATDRFVAWHRQRRYSKLRHWLICSWRNHRLLRVEMTEEAHKVAYLQGQLGDLYECERCHGRTHRMLREIT